MIRVDKIWKKTKKRDFLKIFTLDEAPIFSALDERSKCIEKAMFIKIPVYVWVARVKQ